MSIHPDEIQIFNQSVIGEVATLALILADDAIPDCWTLRTRLNRFGEDEVALLQLEDGPVFVRLHHRKADIVVDKRRQPDHTAITLQLPVFQEPPLRPNVLVTVNPADKILV